MNHRSILVLGGARSGKSRRAQLLGEATELELVYVATGEALDDEMADRIAQHRSDRSARWRTIESPLELPATLSRASRERQLVLVDCLTLWLTNVMLAGRDIKLETASLFDAVATAPGHVILVSNEVGLGLVPDTPLGREFRDAQGRLNQAIAAVCERVEFIAAGLPLVLKG